MVSFLKKLFGKSKKSKGGDDAARYDREKAIAKGSDVKKRMSLASSNQTHKEILYYLAEHDPDPKVRQAVAKNTKTPVQATAVLAADVDVDVRLTLAKRLVQILPDLSKEEHSQLYAFVVQSLGTLALDEVMKIRMALSSTLNDKAYTPPQVAAQLARDVEREVSEPVLRFCTALTDKELMDIIKTHPSGWAIEAIAGRKKVSGPVSKAVIRSDNRPAGQILLENEGADLQEKLLAEIVDKARNYPEWQKPIATRSHLPVQIAKALAQYADESVKDLLAARKDFDKETISEISQVFKRRFDFATDEATRDETPHDKVKRLNKEKRLNEETISDAMAMRDRDLVYAALAFKAKTDVKTVGKIMDMKASKPIVALCWKAGLSMRMALKIQQELAHIPHQELMYPRDGTDFPLSKDEMLWQLEFVGVK